MAKGTRRCYYPAGTPVPEDGGGTHAIERRIVEDVEEAPGRSVRDVAEVLGVSVQLANYYLRKLAGEGLVMLRRRGMKRCVYPVGYEVEASEG